MSTPSASHFTERTRKRAMALIRHILRRLLAFDRLSKRILVFGFDVALCFIAVLVSFSLRLGYWQIWSDAVLALFLAGLAFFPPIFFAKGIYRTILRFSGSGTVLQLAQAFSILLVPMFVIFMVIGVAGVPRTLSFLFPIVFFLIVVISRIMARYVLVDVVRGSRAGNQVKRAMIYGAGWAGQQLANSLSREQGFVLLGFFDDDRRLDRQRLDGVTVFDAANMAGHIDRLRVDTVFLALPNISRSRRLELVEKLQECHVHVQTLPVIQDIVDGHVSFSDLREIEIGDLLGRDTVPPNELLLGRTIAGKTVMVTGAGGSIGSELCRQIIRMRPKRLVVYEMTEHALYNIDHELRDILAKTDGARIELVSQLGTVCDRYAMTRLFERFPTDTVFHTAAYKHVPLVEGNPLSGLRNNILGTLYTAEAARKANVSHFILISTDKAVRPTNVMGASKRVCELVCQALAVQSDKTKFAMVRFGNVLGSSGSVVPQFKEQIKTGGPVTVTHRDVTRYFMTIPEAAQLVIQAGAMAQGGEVYVLDMGKSVRILDLAVKMIELSGRTVRNEDAPDGDIEIVEVGLRPGEKLYEELLIGDNPEPTQHGAIMRARDSFLPYAELADALAQLSDCLDDGDHAAAIELVGRLVPEYRLVELAKTPALKA